MAGQQQNELTDQLQSALDSRAVIEQAKGVLIGQRGLSARAAYEQLRAQARTQRRKLLAVSADVVRGADLLLSTFRQLLLYRALGLQPPEFCHVPLVVDSLGKRIAKRNDALSLRALRAAGRTPEEIRARF